MSVKNKFPDPVADVKLVPKVAYFAPEGVAYFSPEWVAYFAPERWHTIVRIIQIFVLMNNLLDNRLMIHLNIYLSFQD